MRTLPQCPRCYSYQITKLPMEAIGAHGRKKGMVNPATANKKGLHRICKCLKCGYLGVWRN